MLGLSFDQAGDLLRVAIDYGGGPQGQDVIVNKFIPTFKIFAHGDDAVYFPHFFTWMGETRELSAAPILRRLRELTATGRWGLLTNNASLEIVGEQMSENHVLQVRLWSGDSYGPAGSTVDLYFDWTSWGAAGPVERIAVARMKTTWVEILGEGLLRPSPFPKFYQDFIDAMAPRRPPPTNPPPLPEPFRQADRGPPLFTTGNAPRPSTLLAETFFETSLLDGTLVGNLYFSNYSCWLARLCEAYFFALAPTRWRAHGKTGALKCLSCHIEHLREGMPFDTIYVAMYLKALYRAGVDLYFEFFKHAPDGRKTKLAFGDYKAAWMRPDNAGKSTPTPLPEAFTKALLQAADTVAFAGA